MVIDHLLILPSVVFHDHICESTISHRFYYLPLTLWLIRHQVAVVRGFPQH